MTNSAGRRCLASMKNRSAASPKGWPRPAPSRRTIFVERSRRCADFAPSPRPWGSPNRRRGDRGHASRFERAEARRGHRGGVRPEGAYPQRQRGSAVRDPWGYLRVLSARRLGRRHRRRQPRSRGGDRRSCRRSLGQSAARRSAGRSHDVGGLSAAKRQIDEILRRSLPRALAKPVFYAVGGGWRALAKAHMEAVGAPVKVVHGYTLGAVEAREFARAVSRLSAAKLAATPGVTERRARTLPAAALTLDRVLKHLTPRPRRLFRSRPARGVSLLAAQPGGTISRSPGRGRATHRAAARARARFRARTRVLDRQPLFR